MHTAAAVPYQSKHKIRFVTATSLFDGHDAATNIIRRILQASGAEVIHLGHNRSVETIVTAAIQEDAQGIAVSCYQGGHVPFFKYIRDLLKEKGAEHIRVFGGGGGVIVPEEIREIEGYGVSKIFSPDDGRRMGLQGMINHMLELCDFSPARDLSATAGFLAEHVLWRSYDNSITQALRVEAGLYAEQGFANDWIGTASYEHRWRFDPLTELHYGVQLSRRVYDGAELREISLLVGLRQRI